MTIKIAALEVHRPAITYKHVILGGFGKRNPTVAALKATEKKRSAKRRRNG